MFRYQGPNIPFILLIRRQHLDLLPPSHAATTTKNSLIFIDFLRLVLERISRHFCAHLEQIVSGATLLHRAARSLDSIIHPDRRGLREPWPRLGLLDQ